VKLIAKNTYVMIIILASSDSSVSAELFKCMINGRPAYQSRSCDNPRTESILTIKESTPEEKAQAQEKLQAIRSRYDSEKTQKQQNAQQQQEKRLPIFTAPSTLRTQ
jgi:Skp family chaperone for outer membrane proteins